MYKLILSESTKRELKKIPKQHKSILLSALGDLKEDPSLGKSLTKELAGRYAYKIGPYLIIYRINQQDQTVYVSTAGHRKEVYRRG